MDRPRLFLSAVSEELGTARQAVARTIRNMGFDPVSQDDFPTGYGELRQWLREQLDSSEGLIQLVGDGYGAEPPQVDPKYGRISYTQFEFLYAYKQKEKKTWIIVIGKDFPRDKSPDQLDLPRDSNHPDPAGYQAERRVLQREYLARLKCENHLRYTVKNEDQLELIVRRLRDELGELRHQWEEWKKRIDTRLDKLAEAAQITTEKIRAHLLQTAEETHRRELTEAEQATDWRTRQQLREAADNAHTARLSRIEELAASFAEIEGKGAATSVFQEMTRILADQGVDEAIAYVGTQRASIFQTVRARAAAIRERNRADLQPLLRTAELYQAKGQAAEARTLYNEILGVEPDWPDALHAYFLFLLGQGDFDLVRTTLAHAQLDYEEANRVAQRLTSADPQNAQWQRDLSESYDRMGDVFRAQGKPPAALTAYRVSYGIRKALVKRDPKNSRWQQNLSVSHDRMGDVFRVRGKLQMARKAFQASLAIRQSLVKRDPGNSRWQRGLSISHDRMGDVLVKQGDLRAARKAYQASLKIRQSLVKRDSDNTQWQRDLSISHERIGDVFRAQDKLRLAWKAYQASLKIRQSLVKRDSDNTQWQRDVYVSYNKLGDLAMKREYWEETVQNYEAGLAIAKRLAACDLTNTVWQRDLSEFYRELADLAEKQNRPADARKHQEQAVDVLTGIEQRGLHLSSEDRQFLETLREKINTGGQ